MRFGAAEYGGRRMLSLVPVWLGVSLLAFSLANLAPGDPAEIILQRQAGEPPTAEAVEQLRREMGLDAPFAVRYGRWLGGAVRGDFGTSYSSGQPVFRTLAERLPATLQLASGALLLGLLIAIPLGVVAAVNRGNAPDHLSRLIALIGTSTPSFVLGYLLILLFAVSLHMLPVTGSGGWRYLVLPVMTLGLAEAAALTRLTRTSMLEVLGEDYVRTARAKGLPRRVVIMRHALRNALNPVATLAGVRFGRLLGGAVIIENVFARAGIGTTIVNAIHDRDYPMIQGFILFMGTVFVTVNLLVDLSYVWLDPRLRLIEPAERPSVAT
ncbi:MAG: nickel ABC transporter permease [Gemmatimonadaceae bacterium]